VPLVISASWFIACEMETAPDMKVSWEYTEETVADSLTAGHLAVVYIA
jgi:hypothetical protein